MGITQAEKAILTHICQHGPKTGYSLGKETKYSEKTAYESTKSLVKRGMLTREIIGKTRARKDKINYNLTLIGIAQVFIFSVLKPPILNNSMTWLVHLAPLVLGKWVLLNTIDEKYARVRLSWASMAFTAGYNVNSDTSVDTFYRHFYGVFGGTLEDSEGNIHLDWLRQVCVKDSEISTFVLNTFEQTQLQSRDWLHLLKKDSV